ncbi:membrane dipeptidase (plasmid) [Photobacterium sp. DA100]|uniref:dipeptidase n=1 Tax=Photobacterium sp. DA100 TaxID=3027472 RepID=UPI002478D199|nr:membrane dipeptidase [Photobacterium sp. DA100]WEM44162.1 membrane dipeptidase [Photobacterium sp. DA100]
MKLSTIAIATSAALSVSVFAADATIQPIHQGYSDTAPQYEVNGKVISNVDVKAPLWNPRGKTKEQLKQRVKHLVEFYENTSSDLAKTKDIPYRVKYQDAIAINSILPNSVGIVDNTEESFARGLLANYNAGMTMASATVYAFPTDGSDGSDPFQRILQSNNVADGMKLTHVDTVDDIREAKDEGKMALMYNTQGADFVVKDLANIKKAKEAGIRAMNFVYNGNNPLATGSAVSRTDKDEGITELGKQYIRQMNKYGMVIDVSHSSDQTAIDAAKYSTKPILASHSNAAGVYDVSRNMSDEAIKAVASTGGAICSTGIGLFLGPTGEATPEIFAEHVEYTANLVGRDKTCFSTDYLHAYEEMLMGQVPNVDIYPPEKGFGGYMQNVSARDIWAVARILEEKYGWSEKDVRGFLGENLMRVYAANWN